MNKKFAPAILFASLVIVMLGFGIALPLMAFFVTHFNASGSAMGVLMASYSIMQFIFAPVWGKLSDRIGRKPVLMIGIAGYAVAFGLQAFAPNLILFIAARALAGILSSATLPTAMAYMADITSKADRSKGVGVMGAAMGLGMIFGPMLGGLISGWQLPLPAGLAALMQTTIDPESGKIIQLSIPFLVSSALAILALPFVQFLLPESLLPENRQTREQQAAQSTGPRLRQLKQAVTGPLGFFLAMSFLLAFALANLESVLSLYGKQQFSMGPADIGYLMGGMGILSVIEQGILIGPLTRRFGESRLLLGGLLISMSGLVGIALLPFKWAMIVFSLLFNAGNVLLQPSVTSLVSQRAGRDEQGTVMGYNNSFQSLGRAVGPLWAGMAFDLYPTASFWSGAVIQLAAFMVGLRIMARGQSESKTQQSEAEAQQM
jgi:DHA1 family multidrug resistance protein-like MFS transporter